MNLLPDNAGTRNYVNARRLSCLRPGTQLVSKDAFDTFKNVALT